MNPPRSGESATQATARRVRRPAFEFGFGLTLGSALGYLLLVFLGAVNLVPSWQFDGVAVVPLVLVAFHERFWLAFTDSSERPYQLGALMGAAVMAVSWYAQFH
jgi:hypothetical protein